MNNKLFVFLVVVLIILIILALIAFGYSLLKYNDMLPKEQATQTTLDNVELKENNKVSTPEVVEEKASEKLQDERLYILPSNTREITANDLKDMSKEELNRAYNEIFARYGHDFKTKSLRDYFKTQVWYKPIDGKVVSPSELTDLENKNKDIIMSRIKELEK